MQNLSYDASVVIILGTGYPASHVGYLAPVIFLAITDTFFFIPDTSCHLILLLTAIFS
jgi:hypothetical protein